jgi:hypothetical protein
MSSKPPQKKSKLIGYNDDAFGLVFLSGGLLTKDADFEGTFLILSAIAAASTSAGIVKTDTRLPGAVAVLTILISPIVASLRATGSLESLALPDPIEIGLCTVSFIWAFVIWSREKQE